MGDARETQLSRGGELAQQEQQRDRVRAAGHRGDDPRVRRPQAVPACELRARAEKIWHCWNCTEALGVVPEGGLEPPTWRL